MGQFSPSIFFMLWRSRQAYRMACNGATASACAGESSILVIVAVSPPRYIGLVHLKQGKAIIQVQCIIVQQHSSLHNDGPL